MKERVAIVKLKTGYAVASYDFTENRFAHFYGKGSLARAKEYCKDNDLYVVNCTIGDYMARRKQDAKEQEAKDVIQTYCT